MDILTMAVAPGPGDNKSGNRGSDFRTKEELQHEEQKHIFSLPNEPRQLLSPSPRRRKSVAAVLLLSAAVVLSLISVTAHQPGKRVPAPTGTSTETDSCISSPLLFWPWTSSLPPLWGGSKDTTTTKNTDDSNHVDQDNDDKSFKWSSITPNRTLTWHPCYTTNPNHTYHCARLDIPMDWQDPTPSSSARVILAIIRLRANPTITPYLGPVFFNPGGPGGSGIYSLLDHGASLQSIIGTNHDLVTWDPRGVGSSLPLIDCWDGSARERLIWELGDVGVADAHDGVLFDAYARADAVSRVCEGRMGTDGILGHVSTVYHARDMLEILEQMGGEGARLRYWGFSYGTVLGGTFAALWPGRVERMVNDGNVDYKEWYRGTHVNFLRDADRVMEAFYEFCWEAGPGRCAFWRATPGEIRGRLDGLLEKMRRTPVLVPLELVGESNGTGVGVPELVTYSKVRRMLSTALYQPILRFKRVAQVLAALEVGNGRPYYEYTTLNLFSDPEDDSSSPDDNKPPPPPTHNDPSSILCPLPSDGDDNNDNQPPSAIDLLREDTPDAFPAIMCTDALSSPSNTTTTPNASPSLTLPAIQSYYSLLTSISTSVASVQISFKLSCVGRTARPGWRFPSPFTSTSPNSTETIKTAHPILFIANRADNVTPLVSARNNSAMFEDSVVLVQESYGHTSLAAASGCTAGWVRRYFQRGGVPREGTVCEGDGRPFFDEWVGVGGEGGEMKVEGEEGGDELVAAVRKLAGEWRWGVKFHP